MSSPSFLSSDIYDLLRDNPEEDDTLLPPQFGEDDLLTDYIISEDDIPALLTPPTEKWKDFDNECNKVVILMDKAKDYQWDLAKKEN